MNDNDHRLTLTVEEAAKLLGIGRSTAYELVHTGAIPSLRLGRRIVVPRAKVAGQLGVEPEQIARRIQAPQEEAEPTERPSHGITQPSSTQPPSLF